MEAGGGFGGAPKCCISPDELTRMKEAGIFRVNLPEQYCVCVKVASDALTGTFSSSSVLLRSLFGEHHSSGFPCSPAEGASVCTFFARCSW